MNKNERAKKTKREREKSFQPLCSWAIFVVVVVHKQLYTVCVCVFLCACVANYLKFCINLSAFSEWARNEERERRERIIQK